MVFRFLAVLGIGGEWAVGAALVSETWPRRWRPWLAAVLQTGVNVGTITGMVLGLLLAVLPYRTIFLVGILPARLSFGFAAACPKHRKGARPAAAGGPLPGVLDLFRGKIRRTTLLTILVCAFSLSAHWAFLFWFLQHLRNLPDVASGRPRRKPAWRAWR